MKVLHISTFDKGGAAVAAIRLHEGLLRKKVDSAFLFKNRSGNIIKEAQYYQDGQPNLLDRLGKRVLRSTADKLQKEIKQYPRNYENATLPYTSSRPEQHPSVGQANVVNLHWVAGFIDYEKFFNTVHKPVVWTLHDMNPFLGIFHYEGDRRRNLNGLSKLDCKIENKKAEVLHSVTNITVVSPSKWLYREASASKMLTHFPHEYIPYGIDTASFSPISKLLAKEVLGIPSHKKSVLFVSQGLKNKRKGIDLLIEAIPKISTKDQLHFLTVGSGMENLEDHNLFIHFGPVNDQKLMQIIYSATDVFVIPSREDNLPNTVLEAMACGTGTIGFDIGGIPDMISHNETGLLVEPYNISQLAKAIEKATDHDTAERFGKNAREKVTREFSLEIQAEQYLKLYNKLLI